MKTDSLDIPTPGIHVYKGVFNLPWVHSFINSVEKECNDPNGFLYWEGSLVGSETGMATEYRSSVSCSMDMVMSPTSNHPERDLFMKSVHSPISECVIDYVKTYELNLGLFEPYSLLKYTSGAHYRSHYDDGPGIKRTFSVVAYLKNDSTGGDLRFQYFDLTVPCIEGTVLVFPSSYPYCHYAEPVSDGVKYSLVTWYP